MGIRSQRSKLTLCLSDPLTPVNRVKVIRALSVQNPIVILKTSEVICHNISASEAVVRPSSQRDQHTALCLPSSDNVIKLGTQPVLVDRSTEVRVAGPSEGPENGVPLPIQQSRRL